MSLMLVTLELSMSYLNYRAAFLWLPVSWQTLRLLRDTRPQFLAGGMNAQLYFPVGMTNNRISKNLSCCHWEALGCLHPHTPRIFSLFFHCFQMELQTRIFSQARFPFLTLCARAQHSF